MTVKWYGKRYKQELIKKYEKNSNITGKFVESEARQNLLKITNPEWGEKYRRLIVARLLTHIVERVSNQINIYVGTKESKGNRKHGYYIDLGSKTASPTGWLRKSISKNKKKIRQLLTEL